MRILRIIIHSLGIVYSLRARDFDAAFSHAYVGRSISKAISFLSYDILVINNNNNINCHH